MRPSGLYGLEQISTQHLSRQQQTAVFALFNDNRRRLTGKRLSSLISNRGNMNVPATA